MTTKFVLFILTNKEMTSKKMISYKLNYYINYSYLLIQILNPIFVYFIQSNQIFLNPKIPNPIFVSISSVGR